MATIKAYSDLQQSKKLAKIIPLESADMVYVHTIDLDGDEHYNIDFRNNQPLFEDDISAWSLAALLSALPNGIVINKDSQNGRYHFSSKYIGTYVTADNPVDACVDMIIKLNELNLL
jgi:hypothetical protein